MQPDDPTRVGVTTGPRTDVGSAPDTGAASLAPRVTALFERIVEMERALAMREWWLLGRNLPEAQALSEIASLLAVARAELAQVLADVFGAPEAKAEGDISGISPAASESRLDDPEWMQARLTEARQLLDRAAAVLPALLQYAQVLRAHAQRQGLTGDVADAFAIVSDRLGDACELLQHPPEGYGK